MRTIRQEIQETAAAAAGPTVEKHETGELLIDFNLSIPCHTPGRFGSGQFPPEKTKINFRSRGGTIVVSVEFLESDWADLPAGHLAHHIAVLTDRACRLLAISRSLELAENGQCPNLTPARSQGAGQ